MSLSAIPNPLRKAVAARDGDRCAYCGLLQFGQAASFHIDHVTPRCRGGITELNNLAQQCPACSLRKASKIIGADPQSGDIVSLFHPLNQIWQDHFTLQPDGIIVGLSPGGRAIVAELRMNDALPRMARTIQIALGLV